MKGNPRLDGLEIRFQFLFDENANVGQVTIEVSDAGTERHHARLIRGDVTLEKLTKVDELFGKELPAAIDEAINARLFSILSRFGLVAVNRTPAVYRKALLKPTEKALTRLLGVTKTGPKKGASYNRKKHKVYSRSEFPKVLDKTIWALGENASCSEAAKRMQLGSAYTLSRERKKKDYVALIDLSWRQRVKETLGRE